MERIDYKDESRKDWGRMGPEGIKPTNEDITLGCILRIADATEAMAKNYVFLQNELTAAKKRNDYLKSLSERKDYQIRGLKGQITKLKKELASANMPSSIK